MFFNLEDRSWQIVVILLGDLCDVCVHDEAGGVVVGV